MFSVCSVEREVNVCLLEKLIYVTVLKVVCDMVKPYLPTGTGGVLPLGNTDIGAGFNPDTKKGWVSVNTKVGTFKVVFRLDVEEEVPV